jgi:hypothetical protein
MALKQIVFMVAVALPAPAMAQGDWEYNATVYGWFPGVSTTVETPLGQVEAEADFDEVLDTLDIAFLGAIEARKGRWSLIGDLQFFDIGAESPTPFGTAFSDIEIDSQMTLFSAYATYALVDNDKTRFDVGGGVRYNDATVETRLISLGTTPNASLTNDGSWSDLLLAARVNHAFDDRWFVVAYADVGGFGIEDSSELTWQTFAGAGYRLGGNWSGVAGFRHLSIEREFGPANIVAEVSGPFLGFQKSF